MQKMCTNSRLRALHLILIAFIGIALDRITKIMIVNNFFEGEGTEVIPGVLRFTYIRNKGAAFGTLSESRWIFMIASCILIIAVCIYIFRKKDLSNFELISLSLIVSGGIGNMIDRVAFGFVVDFIDVIIFPVWKWIFNVADMLVCIGAGLFVINFIIGEIKIKKGKGKDVNSEA